MRAWYGAESGRAIVGPLIRSSKLRSCAVTSVRRRFAGLSASCPVTLPFSSLRYYSSADRAFRSRNATLLSCAILRSDLRLNISRSLSRLDSRAFPFGRSARSRNSPSKGPAIVPFRLCMYCTRLDVASQRDAQEPRYVGIRHYSPLILMSSNTMNPTSGHPAGVLSPTQERALSFLLPTLIEAADDLTRVIPSKHSSVIRQLCILYCNLVRNPRVRRVIDYSSLLSVVRLMHKLLADKRLRRGQPRAEAVRDLRGLLLSLVNELVAAFAAASP
ncbi:hypothetical protein EXIGLDRAFT_328514 [Exidia glandulosa HHB12029]|uniref:Uncharacterized protein n=1 Tax=Exidia glandulosa HHB12029 TaxID=1314781 RepID=A0A165LPL8_EXIGL|nr:hypothetical protein EXIGLDRAFT_328514 [Exidia glandulosa HHB12029]